MATLDASVLQEIGPSLALDPAGAKMKAYTLKNEMDVSQINTMKIADAKQEMAKKQAIDKALSGNTLATEEDRQRAIADVSKSAGGLAAMDLARTFSQQRQQALQERELEANIQKHLTGVSKDQFEMYTMKNDAFDSTLVPVMDKYKQLTDAGMPSDQAKAAVQVDYQTALMTLVNKTDATGAKIYGDPGSMQKLQQLGPTFDPTKLMPLIADSEKARKYLEEAGKARFAQGKDQAEVAHLRAETGLALERTRNLKDGGGSGLDPDTIESMAERVVLGGEKLSDVAGRLGSGVQGRRDLKDLQDAIARLSKEKGIGPSGIVAQRQETAAQGKASQVAGAQAGKVAVGLAEVRQFGPLAMQASDAVPRGNFTPLSKLIQLGEKKISDVNQKVFLVRHQALLNAYNLVAARAGISAADRDHNRELLEMSDSPEAYKAGVKAIMFEAEQAEQAAQSAMKVPRAGAPAPAATVTVGTIEQGHRFKGGDPADPKNWEPVAGAK